jgi:hypothetical protein
MPAPLSGGLAIAHRRSQMNDVTSDTDTEWLGLCATAATGRLPLL